MPSAYLNQTNKLVEFIIILGTKAYKRCTNIYEQHFTSHIFIIYVQCTYMNNNNKI